MRVTILVRESSCIRADCLTLKVLSPSCGRMPDKSERFVSARPLSNGSHARVSNPHLLSRPAVKRNPWLPVSRSPSTSGVKRCNSG